MPKLAGDIAREAEKAAEEDGPEPVPDGIYTGVLQEVKVSDDEGASGYHYWSWVFKIQSEDVPEANGKKLSFITSLSPKARFSVGGAFKAFGVPADTHTDDLLGRKANLHVSLGAIKRGSRKGQLGNSVESLSQYEGEQPQMSNRATMVSDSDF